MSNCYYPSQHARLPQAEKQTQNQKQNKQHQPPTIQQFPTNQRNTKPKKTSGNFNQKCDEVKHAGETASGIHASGNRPSATQHFSSMKKLPTHIYQLLILTVLDPCMVSKLARRTSMDFLADIELACFP